MPRAAVALASTNGRAADARPVADRELERQLTRLGRPVGAGRSFRPTRAHLILLGIIVVAAWLVVVFARAMTDVDLATARHQTVAAESTTLSLRLDADRRELALVQTDAFQRLQARAYGMGATGEQVFSLAAGAPSAPPITPLGQASAPAGPDSPLDAWLELLFGN